MTTTIGSLVELGMAVLRNNADYDVIMTSS